MKVNVHDILPDKPRHLVFKGTEPFLREILARLTADDGDSDRSGDVISADVTLSREGKNVFVEGTAHATIHPPCSRCLETVTVALDPEIRVALLPKKGDEPPVDQDDESSTYENDEIDVGLVLNEQLLLERPFKVLCKDDCPGLCGTCGADLNAGPCTCAPEPKSLAFAELKNFKPQN